MNLQNRNRITDRKHTAKKGGKPGGEMNQEYETKRYTPLQTKLTTWIYRITQGTIFNIL